MTQRIQDAWTQRKLGGMLLIDVKNVFDRLSWNMVILKMDTLGVNGDLFRWMGLFISESRVSLVVDYH